MVRIGLLLPLVAAARSLGQAIVPNRYVVEFGDETDASELFRKIDDGPITTKKTYDYELFKGVSIQLHDTPAAEQTLSEIQAMPGVRTWQVRQIPRPNPQILWTGSPTHTSVNVNVEKRQEVAGDNFTTHIQTQVDKLRAEGLTGKGIKLAVIDTGVDYKHPALGGCFGPGCLVSFGRDLVGDAYRGNSKTVPKPDNDPMDCGGHGTHVSGIIAAQNNSFGFTGAAPGVTLGMYKVFGCVGQTENDVLIDAFNQAYEDGANIITASIGGGCGWSEEPWTVAVERIVKKGVPCTLAAGNDGEVGMMYASSAASGKGVIAVGSVDNTVTPSLLITSEAAVNGSAPENFLWTPGAPYKGWGNVSLPLWAVGFNTSDPANGCEPYPATTPDLSKYIVLIRRGTCTFVLKAQLAAAKGARYIMLYNNVPGTIGVDVTSVPQIQAIGMVTPTTGAAWVSALAAGAEIKLMMDDPDTVEPTLVIDQNNSTGGSLSSFTSWGPTWELDVNPIVSSPGGYILSTYPTKDGSYAVISGTSMATPLIASIVALIGQKRGTLRPQLIESLLANTATPVRFNFGDKNGPIPNLAPVPQQGAGLVQAYDAAYATTYTDVTRLAFNDTDNFEKQKTFTIFNQADKAVTYTLSNTLALTTYLKANATTDLPMEFPNDMDDVGATLAFTPSTVTIPAGGNASIVVVATPPDLDPELYPVWSGWVTATADDGKKTILPYQGLVGSMHSLRVIHDAYVTNVTPDPDQEVFQKLQGNLTFILPPLGLANSTNVTALNYTYPGVYVNMATGSIILRVDLVAVDDQSLNNQTALNRSIVGSHRQFPSEYETRGDFARAFDGELRDGRFAPPGRYKWLVRALRIYGDPSDPAEYNEVETVPFSIQYATDNSTLRNKVSARRVRKSVFNPRSWL